MEYNLLEELSINLEQHLLEVPHRSILHNHKPTMHNQLVIQE